jgi:hypothetical protein
MSSAHNLPGMAATPHFTKKIGELGLKLTYKPINAMHQDTKSKFLLLALSPHAGAAELIY